MNAAAAERCASQLMAAAGRHEIGQTLVRLLLEECRPDAVVAWLPANAVARLRAADVFTEGTLFADRASPNVRSALSGGDLPDWFLRRGARCHVSVQRLPFVRTLAVAWRDPASQAPGLAPVLELLAGLTAAMLELRRTEERTASIAEELRDAEHQIDRTRRVRTAGELAVGMVHDFNNCLTTILGLSEISLEPREPDDPLRHDLTTIRMAALDAAMLVKRLQMIGRKSRSDEKRDVVDLADIARMMPDMVRPRWTRRAQVEGVSFDLVVEVQPAPRVHVVVAEIRELLLNVLFNAVDAMPAGGRITIAVSGADDGAQISVKDDGIGMSDEVRAHLFEPFFSTKGDQGSGLGLSACQNIARRHGGALRVQSSEGHGTTVVLRLPPAPVRLLTPDQSEVESSTVGQPVSSQPASKMTGDRLLPGGLRVLLVDDQDEVRESLGEMVRALGHQVWTARDGSAAIQTVRAEPLDVVVTDVCMPGMNGIELARQVQTLAPSTSVVLMSGWEMEDDARRPPNVTCLVAKPVTMKGLGEAIACLAPRSSASKPRRVKCS